MLGPASSEGRACALEIFVFSKSQCELVRTTPRPISDAINNSHYMSDLEFRKMGLITKPTRSKNLKIKASLSMSERRYLNKWALQAKIHLTLVPAV